MKKSKKYLAMGLLLMVISARSSAQIVLPEVRVVASSYKYLDAVTNQELAQPVKMLEMKAAAFDVKKSEFYEDEYDTYYVSFYLPEGQILASYDKDGKLLRTAEKFKNTMLPKAVAKAVVTMYPKWTIAKDIYLVNYHDEKGATKVYKIVLENGDKRRRIKLNENGDFL